MQRAVLVEHRHLVGGEHLGGHGLHGNLLAILPELRLRVEQRVGGVLKDLAQLHNALHLHRVFLDKLPVGDQVIAVDAYADAERGLLGVGVVVSCDIGREVLKQRGFVAARGFRKRADDGLHLIRGQSRQVDVFRFHVSGDHGRNVAGRKRRGQRAACDLLIGHHKCGDPVRGQAAGVHTAFLQIGGNVRGNLAGLQGGDIGSRGQILVGADHSRDIFGRQAGHVRAGGRLRIGADQRHNALRRQLRLVRAFRHFRISGNKRLHLRLYALRVLVLAQLGNDRVRRDRAGIRGEGVPPLLRARHVEIRGDGQHLFGQRVAEHLRKARQLQLAVV